MKPLQTHEFTLVLSGVDDNTPELEDKLFEAGCDDVLVNFRNGTVYLDFSREAASILEAVISAIHQTENSRAGVKITSALPDDLVNETDIAKRLNAPPDQQYRFGLKAPEGHSFRFLIQCQNFQKNLQCGTGMKS